MANHVLEILDGDRAGDVLPVTERPLRIGRKPGNDLVLADEKTSGVHAEVVLEGDRHVLRDLGSTNGTFLDGKRVTEIVLSPGDIVTVGRLRVKFRAEGDAPAAGTGGDLAVHQLDRSRLQKRGGSTVLLVGLLVAGLGVGGYLWWQGRAATGGEAVATKGRQAPAVLAGNKLADEIGQCEGEGGWNLRLAGGGFQASTRAHTGAGGFEAVRGEGAEAADFAVAALATPLPVIAGRTVTVSAWLRTEGDALAGVRAVFFSSNDATPFRFRSGSPLTAHAAFEQATAVLAVPPGCDRLLVELVAVLRSPDALAVADDVGVVEAGQSSPIEAKLAESNQTAIGAGAAMAVRSVDPDTPATLLAVLPGAVPAPFEGLHKAGWSALSDLGATWTCTATERSFQVQATGVDSLQFLFPADAAGAVLVADGDGDFRSTAAAAQFQATRVLLGDRMTRAMLQFPAPVACSGLPGGGVYRLTVGSPRAELVLGFRQERLEAEQLLRQARARLDDNAPGAALDLLRSLSARVPHDSQVLGQAHALRAVILGNQSEALRALQKDLGEATFFDTRGGFERVVLGVDELVLLYGEKNVEDLAAVSALRDKARQRLAEIDGTVRGAERARLEALGQAFTAAEQPGLASVVLDYVRRHLDGKQE